MESCCGLTGQAAELLYEQDDSVSSGLARRDARTGAAANLDTSLAAVLRVSSRRCAASSTTPRESSAQSGLLRPDPDALQQAEERLYLLSKLKRRYGGSLQACSTYLALPAPSSTSSASR